MGFTQELLRHSWKRNLHITKAKRQQVPVWGTILHSAHALTGQELRGGSCLPSFYPLNRALSLIYFY